MPCNPDDIILPSPTGPSGPALPGFGLPFALPQIPISTIDGMPEDLLDLFDKFQFLIGPGIIKPSLSINFGKDAFDAIMSMLDKVMPFLMVYKLILPLLNIIVCIIEVICAIANPFKLIRAVRRLFKKCLPQFLNLFPVLQLIILIISLLLLLLALIEYILDQINKLIDDILRNLNALVKSFSDADENSVLAIAKKIGSMMCDLQNVFLLLSLINLFFAVIRDILSKSFNIPPCDNSRRSGLSTDDSCCSPDVCPAIVQTDYTRLTGTLQYVNTLGLQPTTPFPGLPNFSTIVRSEGWTIYDVSQEIQQAFINIVDAYDVTTTPKPVFFPTDANYTASTPPSQAAYTINMRMYYNPISWGRVGPSRFIRFNDCIVQKAPTNTLVANDGYTYPVSTGTLSLVGGIGYEDDNTTPLFGFASDGITETFVPATLENFLHLPERFSITGDIIPTSSDGYTFSDVEYTFTPIYSTLIGKQLITLGCDPSVAFDKAFINDTFAGDIGFKTDELIRLLNSTNADGTFSGQTFPDPDATQQCLQTALAALRSNMTPEGVAVFQATTAQCLNKLKTDTVAAIGSLVGIGYDPCNSNFTLEPNIQFTSRPIIIKVNINDSNGLSLVNSLTPELGAQMAPRIKAYPTLGEVSNFAYDGYGGFTANLTASIAGEGQMMISFDDNIFCTNNIPEGDATPTHDLKIIDYSFVFTPVASGSNTSTGNTSDGQPRRDEGDVAREGVIN